jgi:hypothetical protein
MDSIKLALSEAKSTNIAFGLVAIIVISGFAKWSFRSDGYRGFKEIPGPPGLPILKNALDLPQKDQFIAFNKLYKQYGA